MDELVRKVYDTIKKSEMICQGDSVIVGVSGGADSVCLLSVLKNLQMSMDLKLTPSISITACVGKRQIGTEIL